MNRWFRNRSILSVLKIKFEPTTGRQCLLTFEPQNGAIFTSDVISVYDLNSLLVFISFGDLTARTRSAIFREIFKTRFLRRGPFLSPFVAIVTRRSVTRPSPSVDDHRFDDSSEISEWASELMADAVYNTGPRESRSYNRDLLLGHSSMRSSRSSLRSDRVLFCEKLTIVRVYEVLKNNRWSSGTTRTISTAGNNRASNLSRQFHCLYTHNHCTCNAPNPTATRER